MSEENKVEAFHQKLAAVAQEAAIPADEGGNINGEVKESDASDEEAEGQEEVLDGDEGADDDAAPSDADDDDGIDTTPRVSLKKYQKAEETARRAEQMAFEANTRLNAWIEANKTAKPIAEQPKPQNPYDKDFEPERFELWNTQLRTRELEEKVAKFEQGQQQTHQQRLHSEAINMISNDVAKQFDAVKKSGTIPDINEIFAFVSQKVAETGLPGDFLLGKALVPISEGRVGDVPGIYKNLAIAWGYKAAKKGSQPNFDAVERNRGKSSGITKSASAATTGTLSIQDAKPKSGRGTDPKAFAKLLENVRNNT